MNTTPTPLKHTFLLAALALFLVGTSALRAGNAGIQDNGGFFSEAAKADAKGNITEVQRTLHKDILVETMAAMPAEVKNGVNLQDKSAVGRAYESYVDKRAAAEQVNGVYIFLVKDPAHLQVAVGNDTQRQAFTLADRDELVKKMLGKLRAKDYDGALREGVAFVATTMRQHHGGSGHAAATSTAPWNNASTMMHQESSSSHWGLISIVIFLVIVFVVIRVIGKVLHMLFGGGYSGGAPMGGAPMGTPMGGYGGGYGGGGGGFLRSLMGGMLGGAAGSWMYDSFFGSRGSSSYGAPPSNYDQSGGGGYSGQDSSFSSSGSDFSDSGGGGGGGDFGGGGDSGGGGGDSGGGGDF